ncbi:winged helix-turn-helix domain-containing protein [Yinghuangia seranimata]|uniref:winged helix-turn-helix domain-containing protein n=1 Tax=Yinghuangia seranimata TaxID=408067 RepID=UPI00248D05D5|nr:winged helix-turn-helix domain-containing protein [Yinghuangia seranimata]MDI2124867.1 winged helix-turn-helix domain-containing protein [Yinghuangia seranimata]
MARSRQSREEASSGGRLVGGRIAHPHIDAGASVEPFPRPTPPGGPGHDGGQAHPEVGATRRSVRGRPAPPPGALVRPRLIAVLDAVRDARPVLLSAAAGHGKTTLLDQYAERWPGPVVRIRFLRGDTDTPREVRARVAEKTTVPGTLAVVDDLHHLPDAAHVFEHLAMALPPGAHLLAATRPLPALNLSRAELADTVVVGPDDLRLRWWEVDRLFTDVHGRPADPVLAWDAAWLTGGWAAPLHEFLLCTRELSPRQARRTLTAPGVPFAAGYLDRQILDDLDAELSVFLTRIAILTECTIADVADADTPAARAAAGALLRRGERHGVLMRRGAAYAGEQLLRHLLVHRLATTYPDAPAVFAAAIPRMRDADDPVGAAWAAYLARDREALRELMDRNPVVIAAALPEHWHGLLRTFAGPARPVDRQAARMVVGDLGVLTEAGDTALHATGTAISGLVERPLGTPVGLPFDPRGDMLHGITLVASGDYRGAERVLGAVAAEHAGAPGAAAALMVWLSRLLGGHGGDVRDVEAAASRVAGHGPVWLARMARAALTLTGASEHLGEAEAVRAACERLGDVWGAAIAGHIAACAGVLRGEPDPGALERAARGLEAAGLTAAVPWALTYEALARAQLGDSGAHEYADRAAVEAERWELPGAVVLARAARLLADPAAPGADHDGLAVEAERLGIRLDTFLRLRRGGPDPQATPVDIRCFGGFAVRLAGKPLDLLALAPQSRVLLRLLALHAGHPVHREVLALALWPDAPADAAFHRLQTAVYKLRRFLEPARGRRGASEFVPFEDGAYRLRLPEGSYLDVAAAEGALARARQAAARRDAGAEARTLRELLSVADAVLLPETGPEEWVVGPRERWADVAAEARHRLGELAESAA